MLQSTALENAGTKYIYYNAYMDKRKKKTTLLVFNLTTGKERKRKMLPNVIFLAYTSV